MAVYGCMASVVIKGTSDIHETNREKFPPKLMSVMSFFPKCHVECETVKTEKFNV